LVSEVPITVRKHIVDLDKDVYDYYGPRGVFLVHRTQQDHRIPRHHAIYVDTGKLIETERFQQKLQSYVETEFARAPDLILGPGHPRATRLSALLAERLHARFGRTIPQFSHSNLFFEADQSGHELPASLARLTENNEIVIIDDAFVTGTRLYQYSQHLRYIGNGYRGRVRFLVAIARPSSMSEWTEARRLLGYRPRLSNDGVSPERNTLDAMEIVVLPNWGYTECPWCIEAGKLKTYKPEGVEPPALFADRQELLDRQSLAGGMGDQLFLSPGSRLPIHLAGGSLFTADKSPSTAFASVAGGLKRLRTDPDEVRLGPHRYPLATVLESKEYLKTVYTDSLLRASFFRAAHKEELQYHDPDKEKQRTIYAEELINDESGQINNLALELLWATVEEKLPTALLSKISDERSTELGIAEEAQYVKNISRSRGPI